jgi:hypothetical protein
MRPVRDAAVVQVGLAGVLVFCASLVALHLANAQQQPEYVSSYAHRDAAWMWPICLLSLVVGGWALAISLFRAHPSNGWTEWSARFLASASTMPVFLLIFPTDRTWTPGMAWTWHGKLHDTAAITMLAEVCVSMLLLARAARRHPSWRRSPGTGPWWASVCTVLTGVWLWTAQQRFAEQSFFLQRVLLGLMMTWMIRLGSGAVHALAPGPVTAREIREALNPSKANEMT